MKFGVFVVLLSPEGIGGTVLDSAISGEAGGVVMQKGRNEKSKRQLSERHRKTLHDSSQLPVNFAMRSRSRLTSSIETISRLHASPTLKSSRQSSDQPSDQRLIPHPISPDHADHSDAATQSCSTAPYQFDAVWRHGDGRNSANPMTAC